MATRSELAWLGLWAIAASCTSSLRERDPAPALEVQWLQGAPLDPRSAGGVTVVELWATWCGPCVASVDDLDALQRRWRDHDVRVVAVAVRDDLASVQRFVERRGQDLAYAIAFDRDGSVQRQWRAGGVLAGGIPVSFVVGRDGLVVAVTHPVLLDHAVTWAVTRAPQGSGASDAGAWTDFVARVRAQHEPAARAAAARQAFAALQGDAIGLAEFVAFLARTGDLEAVGGQAYAALQATRSALPAIVVPVARVLAAHAAGGTQLAEVVAAEAARLREQPHELLALSRAIRMDGRQAGAPVPPALERACLQFLEVAAAGLGPARTALPMLFLLIATGAEADRIDAVGRQAVAALGDDVGELNSLAWALLTDAASLARTRATALRAAQAMTAVEGWDEPSHLDTLALARFENGDIDGAIAAQQQAIGKLDRPDARYQQRLERYLQAKQPMSTR